MSAGSKTQPGGYAEDHPELEQFAVSDERTSQFRSLRSFKKGWK